MRSAIVGYGNIGRVHARCIEEDGHTLVAVCDIDPIALKNAPGERHYIDYLEMLDKEELDAVHICTPHYLHADMIIEALARNINVLCEKPLCITEEDIVRILEATERTGAQVGVCMQNRYNSANLYVKEYISNKSKLSATGSVSWHRDVAYYRSGEWRGRWETEGGGVLINQALHTLDLVQWMVGMPDALRAMVSCMTLADDIEVEDTAVILASQDEGGFVFYATNGAPTDTPVEITLCADGECIKIMPRDVLIGDRHLHFDDTAKALGKACYGSGHAALIADYYDCISTGRKFEIDAKEAAKVVRIILAAYRSHGKNETLSK